MSTYNGEEFIEEQLDSILGQNFSEFRLIVRDDGSTDSTLDILRRYRDKDERVRIVIDELGNLGSSRSFMRLLELSDADFFMLADQDDIWTIEKITSAMLRIEELQAKSESQQPLLIFTDLVVCDENLNEISSSLWKHQRLNPELCRNWRKLLAQNVVTGCTILGNAAARRVSLPFVLNGMFHDHWIAVNVAKMGIVDYIAEASVLYRQHSENTEGAKDFGYRYARKRLSKPGIRYSFYRKAGRHFGTSPNRILLEKVIESIRRFTWS